ncbi:MAG: hypothetical protein JXR30_00210 [Alphaproteobacteria bacterium]|nr:hypothetical protein [Alphaproteobacteria bacterium]
MRFLAFLSFAFLAFFCSGLVKGDTLHFGIDDVKYLPYGQAEGAPEMPFLAIHQSGNKTLFFLASKHGNKAVNQDTFDFIDRIFETYKFGTVFVEGMQYKEAPDKNYENHINTCANENFKNCGEVEYTYLKALEKNIPVFGAEPTVSEQNEMLIADGFEKEDLYMFYLFRHAYLQKQTSKITSEEGLFKLFEEHQTDHGFRGNSLKLDRVYSLEEIKAYYQKKLGKALKFETFSDQEDDPVVDSKIIFQQIANLLLTDLDKNVFRKIEEKFKKSNSILLVLGAGHYSAYDSILQKDMPRKTFVESSTQSKPKNSFKTFKKETRNSRRQSKK